MWAQEVKCSCEEDFQNLRRYFMLHWTSGCQAKLRAALKTGALPGYQERSISPQTERGGKKSISRSYS
jgi:hypothetical protein